MLLQRKVVFLVAGCFATLLMLFSALAALIILNDFRSLERTAIERDARRMGEILHADLAYMANNCRDWAEWDDSVALIEGSYPDYFDDNISTSTYSELEVDGFFFIDAAGELVAFQGIDHHSHEPWQPSAALLAQLTGDAPLLRQVLAERRRSGWLSIDGAVAEVACNAIRGNEGDGPAHGMMVMLRWIDGAHLDKMARTVAIDLRWIGIEPQAPASPHAIQVASPAQTVTPIIVDWRIDEDIQLRAGVPLLDGSGHAILAHNQERPLMQRAWRAWLLLVGGSLLCGLACIPVLVVLLRRFIVARLIALQTDLKRIDEAGDASLRVAEDDAQDSISELAHHINQTIAALEESQQRTQSAQRQAIQASAAKSAFLADLSHEIRTPLNGILGMSRQLLDAPLEHEAFEQVHTIHQCGEHLLRMLNDVLDMARIEAGRFRLDASVAELPELIRSVGQLFSGSAAAKGLLLSASFAPDCPQRIFVDEHRMRQVLGNLISNAVKFTDAGQVTIRCERDDNHVRILVRDTGCGIAEDVQSRLFNAFEQGEPGVTKRFGGSGLGLALCSKLLGLMQGSIELASEQGHGSTFTVRLPIGAGSIELPPQTQIPDEVTLLAWGPCWQDLRIGERRLDPVADLDELTRRVAAAREPIALLLDCDLGDEAMDQCIGLVQGQTVAPLLVAAAPSRDLGRWLAILPSRQCRLLVRRSLPRELGSAVARLLEERRHATGRYEVCAIGSARKRILVVDDSPVNRQVARGLLDRYPTEIREAANGMEALRLWEEWQPDLILMDVRMPGMDGIEACRRIRAAEAEQGRFCAILAMTADLLPENVQACTQVGMDDLLAKPLSREDLDRAMRKLLLPIEAEAKEDATPPGDAFARRLHELERDLDRDIVDRLLDTFAVESTEILGLIERHRLTADWPQVGRELHRLRGIAANIGLDDLAQRAGVFEQRIHAGHSLDEAAAQELQDLTQAGQDRASAWLASQAAIDED